MKGLKKNAFNAILVFTILGYIKPALGIFLLPIYLEYISPSDYGVLGMVGVFTSIALIISNVSISSAMRTFYFDFNDDESSLDKYLTQIFSVNIIMVSVFCIVLFNIGESLYQWVFTSDIPFYPYGAISIVNACLTSAIGIYFIYIKNKVRLKEFAIYTILSIIISVSVQYYLIVYEGEGILGALVGNLVATIVVLSIILIRRISLITWKIDFKFLKPSFTYVIYLLPFLLLLTLDRQLDKIILERYMSMENVGLYVLLMSIVGLTGILFSAVDNAIRPFLYEALKEHTSSNLKEVNEYLSFYILVGLIAISGMIMVGNNLGILTDNVKYLEIRQYFVFAGFVMVPTLFVRFYALIYVYYKKSGSLTLITFFKTGLLILLLVFLIPKYGILGALISIFIAELVNQYIFRYQIKSFGLPSLSLAKNMLKISIFLVLSFILFFIPTVFHGWWGLFQFIFLAISLSIIDINVIKNMISRKITS